MRLEYEPNPKTREWKALYMEDLQTPHFFKGIKYYKRYIVKWKWYGTEENKKSFYIKWKAYRLFECIDLGGQQKAG